MAKLRYWLKWQTNAGNRNGPIGAQAMHDAELTSRFENIEMYEIDYSLAWKLEKWKQTIWQ